MNKIFLMALTTLMFSACAVQDKYICASNGFWYSQEPTKMQILKDKEGNFLSCLDGKSIDD